MTEPTFASWLRTAKPKDQCRYFSGARLGWAPEVEAVRWAYNAGIVDLVQRRNGPAYFDYLAVFKAHIVKPASPLVIDNP